MEETLLEALKGINAYPIPLRTILKVAERRGVTLSDTATADNLAGSGFNLATADLLMWLVGAPDVTQGGQSYSFTDEQRKQMKNEADALYGEFGDDEVPSGVVYGYKGSRP